MADAGIAIEHPNREKTASKATRATVVVAAARLRARADRDHDSAAWDALVGAKACRSLYIVLYLGIAFFVARWSRGVLPVAAALAIVLLIFAAVSVPGWFARDKPGFDDPALASDVVGILTALLIPLQLLLIGFAMRGFQQAWNVEVERPLEPARPPSAAHPSP